MPQPDVALLIVAAGRGLRAGGGVPKQYRAVAGRPLLAHTLAAFLGHPRLGRIQAVIHPDDQGLYEQAVGGLDLPQPVFGGAARQDSVRFGLEALARSPDGALPIVLIHDAARPFVDGALIDRVLAGLAAFDGAVPALPLSDTIKRGQNGLIVETVPRENLFRVQTPQGFRLKAILAAHRAAAGRTLTDDAAVAEAARLKVALVTGDADNEKITDAADFTRAETRLSKESQPLPAEFHIDIRTGQGFDVHRFGPGDHVMLCGVAVPHEFGLAGHSDADVGLHALTDALLGAVGAGDIGAHFPPSDPQWKGAPSDRFLRHAATLVAAAGGTLLHVDVTLICERPKVGPVRAAMVARVAEILELAPDRVSIKATTTEKLGFTGRGEGVAAQAVATIRICGGPPT